MRKIPEVRIALYFFNCIKLLLIIFAFFFFYY